MASSCVLHPVPPLLHTVCCIECTPHRYIATESCDRSLRVYSRTTKKTGMPFKAAPQVGPPLNPLFLFAVYVCVCVCARAPVHAMALLCVVERLWWSEDAM